MRRERDGGIKEEEREGRSTTSRQSDGMNEEEREGWNE